MGNASRRPRTMVHVRVQQQQRAAATPSRDISGFVKDNGYALEFVLRAEEATVRELLKLVNAYREHPIARVQRRGGAAMADHDVVANGDTVYIV